MHSLKQLKIWHKALKMADHVYTITNKFPAEERYGVIQQMKRAAGSIGSNITEGAGRNSEKEFNQFLGIASGSACELIFQSELSFKKKLMDANQLQELSENLDHRIRMNFTLQNRLRNTGFGGQS